MENAVKLPFSFYRQEDVIEIAKNLLGKYLFTKIDGKITGGIIIETEGYKGIEDKACHAYNGCFTNRTKTMYENGGVSYVYFCYGMHHLLNVVTNKKNTPHAVLIRAIEPTHGIDIMLKRRNKAKLTNILTSGPGALCQALGITKEHNNIKLNSSLLWIENRNISVKEKNIIKGPRVGVDYAKEHALLPWRFRIKPNDSLKRSYCYN